jgi:hypothetical protein
MDLVELLEDLEWSTPRQVKTKHGLRTVMDLVGEPDQAFWKLWREDREGLKELGIAVANDLDEWTVSWWQDVNSQGVATHVTCAPLPVVERVKNYLDDDGRHVLDPLAYSLLSKPGQRNAVMTLFSVFSAGERFALDASEMGLGKTYHALGLMRSIGLNFGVVCPANVVTKWENTCMEPFDLVPEFVMSWERLRLGGHPDFCERIRMARGGDKFQWHAVSPVVLIFDEIHNAANEKSLNAALFRAALDNPNVFSVGLSGTMANDPTGMRDLGHALGLHSGHDFWRWAKANGCRESFWGALEFTKNRTKAFQFLASMHSHIFPRHGCRLLKSELKGVADLPPHDIFVTPVDSTKELSDVLAAFLGEIKTAREEDKERAESRADRRKKKNEEDDGDGEVKVSGAVISIRDRQRAELLLVPYVCEQAREALNEGQSVPIFCEFDGTLHALGEELKDISPMFYNGSVSATDKRENLRRFQSNTANLLLLNLAAGSESIDLHDLSGIHPRYSIIFPTFRAKKLLQACARIDRTGKKSRSQVELVFLTTLIHRAMMKAVQRRLDNLSLLNDGELSTLRLV